MAADASSNACEKDLGFWRVEALTCRVASSTLALLAAPLGDTAGNRDPDGEAVGVRGTATATRLPVPGLRPRT